MSTEFHVVFLLLGANLGDRQQTLSQARNLIYDQVGPVLQQSGLYETAPWGVENQPSYINQVLQVATTRAAEEVLSQTQAIEQQLGRVRLEKWGSRLIDIDLLYYDQLTLQTETLTIPHPYLHLRRFTLVPLAEIAPNFRHPVFGKTSQTLLHECPDTGEVTGIR